MYGYRRRRDCMDGENWTKPSLEETAVTGRRLMTSHSQRFRERLSKLGSRQRCRFAIRAEDMRKLCNADLANIQEVVFVSLLTISGISNFPDLVIDLDSHSLSRSIWYYRY